MTFEREFDTIYYSGSTEPVGGTARRIINPTEIIGPVHSGTVKKQCAKYIG
jgi:hypothetical protein